MMIFGYNGSSTATADCCVKLLTFKAFAAVKLVYLVGVIGEHSPGKRAHQKFIPVCIVLALLSAFAAEIMQAGWFVHNFSICRSLSPDH